MLLIFTKKCWCNLLRPWKLAMWSAGMAWLIWGALTMGFADWDIGVSLIMGSLTFVFAPWTILLLLSCARNWQNALPRLMLATVLTWAVVDGSYTLYHLSAGNPLQREANFWASLCLYLLVGIVFSYPGSIHDLIAATRDAIARSPKD